MSSTEPVLPDPRHVVVAMSGGVDSAVAALLLVREGYRVTGLFMSNGVHAEHGDQGRKTKGCCSAADARDAAACARALGIEFHSLDFKRAFAKIIDRFVDEYRRGRTPNPCVECNQRLKFGKLITYARGMGASLVATGHYARVAEGGGRRWLERSADPDKDQTYVLTGLTQTQLAHVLLPLGGLTKPEVRALAAEAGLVVSGKAESQDICFVPGGDYRAVLAERGVEMASGEIVDDEGEVVGTHQGIERFTIGQRRGLGVALGEPRYVLRIEPAERRVVIGPKEALDAPGLVASGMTWMRCAGLPEGATLRVYAQIRYHHVPAAATVEGLADGRVRVIFDVPQPAVTPGQALCLYGDDGAVEGGGWIDGSVD